MADEEFEYIEFGEIGWYDMHRGESDIPSIHWIWSGPDKEFSRAQDIRGFGGGEPYVFQHIIQDPRSVYIKVPIGTAPR